MTGLNIGATGKDCVTLVAAIDVLLTLPYIPCQDNISSILFLPKKIQKPKAFKLPMPKKATSSN
eukprot:c16352_g1_i1 orf=269-460(+)